MTSDTLDLGKPRLSHRVRQETQQFQVGTTLLDIALAPFWLLGWVVFWVLLLVTQTGRLTVAAVRVGWMDARERAQTRQIAADRWPVKPKSPRVKAAAGGPR